MNNDIAILAPKERAGSLVTWPASVERVVICVGAQKAATSFLYRALEHDNRICASPVKEVHYWDTIGGREPRRFRRRAWREFVATRSRRELELAILRHIGTWGYGRYRDFLLRDYQGQPVVFEASPSYALCRPDTLAKMGRIAPDTRLILIVRDPVERMWSAAKYMWRGQLEDGRVSESEIIDFFVDRVNRTDSIGHAHSTYDRTIKNFEVAGQSDKLTVLFQETLSEPSERAALAQAVGFHAAMDFKVRANTHLQHFPLPDDARAAAIKAFGATYNYMHDRFGDRVPEAWQA